MKSNSAVVNEIEHEDIIYENPDDCIQDEQDQELIGDNDCPLKIVSEHEELNTESEQGENPAGQEIANITVEVTLENLDVLIEQLPDQFPAASETIKNEIAPLLIDCGAGIKDHYVKVIKKKTNAASIKSVSLLIEEAIENRNSSETIGDEEPPDEIQTDPEIIAMADQIAKDPMLFKHKIDVVNQLGVIGERKNIGLNFLVMDSCLLPMGGAGSEALALKNSGHYGAGKSFPLFMCLKLYPKSAYHLVTGGSDKSLYHIQGGLKHKALILAEALALESSGRGDNELAYAIRSLVSEGHLKYQYTGWKGKEKVTIVKKMEGPTSLLTTTIHGKLEEQLEDRMITTHPNTTAEQTKDIISRTAEIASGSGQLVDDKTITALKYYHNSLESVEVIVPYATDIADFINRCGPLPISARRAYKRVLSATKTIALIHQKQRETDKMGRVIAEYCDYTLACQLVEDAYMESIGNAKRYTDNRIKIIEKHGKIMPKDLAKVAGVSVAAISQWMKPLLKKEALMWVDQADNTFADVESMEKAKRSGKAYIKVGHYNRLPTPFELTNDDRWDTDGEFYRRFDLELGDESAEYFASSEFDEESYDIPESSNLFDVVDRRDENTENSSVKVLSENMGSQNENCDSKDGKGLNLDSDALFKDFHQILSPEKSQCKTEKGSGYKNNNLPPGILTI
jgi:hypothetical protein